jgi:hypothetical protein
MDKAGSRFGFGDSGARKKLTIQPDASVRPVSRSSAVKNVELIGAVEFGLWLIERDDLA